MKDSYSIDFNPTEKDFDIVHEWLISTQSGFLNNISIIENSFKKHSFITFQKGSEIIGFLTFSKYSSEKIVKIQILEIKKDFRKQGVGKFFINEFLNELKKQKILLVELNCAPEISQHFWRKMGFIDKIYSHEKIPFELYKILEFKNTTKINSDYEKEKITIWDEYGMTKFNKEFEIHKITKFLNKPFIINCLNDWEIKWQKGDLKKTNQVKRITRDGLYYGDFIIIEKSIFD